MTAWQRPHVPRRETMRAVKPKQETDVERTHRLFRKIVDDFAHGDRHRFAKALVQQLHRMRLTPSVLLTEDGLDAVNAVAVTLDGQQQEDLRPWRTAQMLPKVWLKTLTAVLGPAPKEFSKPIRLPDAASRFTNTIKIR